VHNIKLQFSSYSYVSWSRNFLFQETTANGVICLHIVIIVIIDAKSTKDTRMSFFFKVSATLLSLHYV